MSNHLFTLNKLPGSSFGQQMSFKAHGLAAAVSALENTPNLLLDALLESDGVLVIRKANAITDDPSLLLRLSHLFGGQVEDYTKTLSTRNMVHTKHPHILVMANRPPSNRQPPPRPDPPLTTSGELPVQFPHRRGWHTDQSFRRPPPDISLFYAVTAAPRGQGQTLYADGYAAYEGLSTTQKRRIESLQGLHSLPWTGRSESAVLAGNELVDLLEHQRSQKQPLVRTHPVTGRKALYLCEDAQMDWVDGPIAGMQPGPGGDGAKLLYEIMGHFTQRKYTYTHEWSDSDLVIHDNRNIIHSATWYDADKYPRHMWRTTVTGNAGPEYEGETPSWLPPAGIDATANLPNQ